MTEKELPVDVLPKVTPIAQYRPIKAAIAALAKKHGKTVFDVSTTKGMEAAKAARAEIRAPRYKVEHIRKALKADALAHAKRIDAEAGEYEASLLAIETPIHEQIQAEDKRKADEKAERERVAAERAQAITIAINEMSFVPVYAAGKDAGEIAALMDELRNKALTDGEFGDRVGEAGIAKSAAVAKLEDLHTKAVEHEAAHAKFIADRDEAVRVQAEQARIQAEKAAADAEAVRIEKERQDKERADLDAERQRQADAQADIDRQRAELAEMLAKATPVLEPAPVRWPALEHEPVVIAAEPAAVEPEPVVAEPDPVVIPEAMSCVGLDVAALEQAAPPSLADMVEVISDHYEVSYCEAQEWILSAAMEAEEV